MLLNRCFFYFNRRLSLRIFIFYLNIELFQFLIDYLDAWRVHFPVLRFWLGPFPVFLLYTPEGSEVRKKY